MEKLIFKKKYLYYAAIILFFAFIFYSYLVAKELFTQWDFDTTVKIQDKIPRRVDYVFSLFSILGSAEVTGIIWLLIVFWAFIKRWWLTVLSLFLLPLALAIEIFGKVFVLHPGPPHLFYRGVIDFDLPSHYVVTSYSYPSGHMTRTAFLISFLMVWVLFHLRLKYQVVIQSILLLILIIMFISRIYLGEHWTTDVIGGLLIGASFGIISGLTIKSRE